MRLFRTVVVLLVSAVVGSAAHAQTQAWSMGGTGSNLNRGFATAAVNRTIYSIGGAVPCNSSSVNTVTAYDTVTGTWSTKASLLIASQQLCAGVINGIIYAAGGGSCCGPSNALQAYDPATNTWTLKASMPTARYAPSAAVVNGKLYVMGGGNGQGANYTTVEVYDPATNTWSTRAPMTAYRGAFAIGVVDGIVYIAGGFNAAGQPLNTVEAYDPANNTWSARPPLLAPRGYASGGTLDGKFYVMGGRINNVTTSAVDVFDPVTSTWSAAPEAPTPVDGGKSAEEVHGKMYLVAFSPGPDGYCPGAPETVYVLGPAATPTCGSADFNGDGDVGTDQDIEAFFRVLGGGNC